jgi:hypothetical protein
LDRPKLRAVDWISTALNRIMAPKKTHRRASRKTTHEKLNPEAAVAVVGVLIAALTIGNPFAISWFIKYFYVSIPNVTGSCQIIDCQADAGIFPCESDVCYYCNAQLQIQLNSTNSTAIRSVSWEGFLTDYCRYLARLCHKASSNKDNNQITMIPCQYQSANINDTLSIIFPPDPNNDPTADANVYRKVISLPSR